ncbi:uncharacterized protein LOC111408331 [Olea europaea var. sylvestris]|uniref:uncharacterized protein LOC111408331 n=1 Tax=Olea europaea var. sylvestris TaxID=158386 RepID=UPI000C1D82B3|nr:uncharacterized protein LOC111408331 [Olea europaea var. sylvestris]
MRDHKEMEFLRLVQGNMELFEYESKFKELSRYTLHLVSTEFMKAKYYEKGLRPKIRQIVSSHDLTNFQAVVKKVQIVTYSGVKLVNQGQRKHLGKRKWQDKNRNTGQFKKQMHAGQSNNLCGQPSHVASLCPSIKKSEQEKKGKARVFALTHDEDTKNSNVIAGILSVSNIPVNVLIDSGATNSFISNACLAKINALCQKNASVFEVSMPSGGTIDVDRIAKGVQIDFDGLTLEAELYVIDMKDFDIILGMN